ncbi:MAG: hypothetical protein DCC71_25085, partial [Proteobacteria bacterium]
MHATRSSEAFTARDTTQRLRALQAKRARRRAARERRWYARPPVPPTPAPPAPPPASRRDRVLALGLAAAAAAYLLPLRAYGLMLNDDGWYLHPAMRMLAGEVLYRDVGIYYAPLSLHAFAWLFEVTGPSIVAARTAMLASIVATVALGWLLARRFAPPALAWLPVATYALVPGPWHKAYYGTCTAAFFLLLARLLDAPSAARAAALGACAGVTLVTRQDLGVLQVGLALGAAALAAIAPGAFGLAERSL